MLKSLSIAALSLGIAITTTVAPAVAEDTLHLKKVDIMDPSGFRTPVRYAVSVVPADWKTEGGMVWNVDPNACNNGVNFAWQATSAEEDMTIAQLPNMGWQGNTFSGWKQASGCVVPQNFNPESIASLYLQQMFGSSYNIVQAHSDAQMDQAFTKIAHQSMGPAMVAFGRSELSATLRGIEFTATVEGQQIKGIMVSPIMNTRSRMPMGGDFSYGLLASPIFVFAKPEKYAEAEQYFEVYLKNFREDPAWKIAKWNSDAEFRRRNPKPANTWKLDTSGSEILDMGMSGWKKRWDANSTGHSASVDAVHGVNTYHADTPTGLVNIPTNFDHSYQMADGTIIATNDAFYEGGTDGVQLNRAR